MRANLGGSTSATGSFSTRTATAGRTSTRHIEGPGTTSPTVNIASSGLVDVKVSPKGRKPRRRTPALVIAVCVGLLRPDVVHGWASWATVQGGPDFLRELDQRAFLILVDIFKGRRWPRTGRLARMAHGAWRMGKALSAPLTGHRPGRAKAARVVRQLVWVEDRVASGRGHLQQLATRCRSYGLPPNLPPKI